jgi:CheY-like chemotaxis protein
MSLKVLAVDDEPLVRTLMQFSLKQGGFQFELASNGRQALEKVASFDPDLILLDVMMPGMSGIEVCLRLKRDDATKKIPIIFVTALPNNVAKLYGAETQIQKPFTPSDLVHTVQTIWEARGGPIADGSRIAA